MRGDGKPRACLWAVLVAGAVSTAWAEPDPAGDTFRAPDPSVPAGSTTPDMIEVGVWRSADLIHVDLRFTGEIRPADDESAIDLQLLGFVDFGVPADDPGFPAHKGSLTTVPDHLELIAYVDFSSVSDSAVWLKDRTDALLTSLPIDFGFDTVSVNVPADLFPAPVEGFDVLVHNYDQDTWDMFPNAEGHAEIVPEPTSFALLALILSWVGRRRHVEHQGSYWSSAVCPPG